MQTLAAAQKFQMPSIDRKKVGVRYYRQLCLLGTNSSAVVPMHLSLK